VEYERTLKRLKSSMDADVFATLWKKGQALNMEAAISYALEAAGRFTDPLALM
jgi:hypothetical protein